MQMLMKLVILIGGNYFQNFCEIKILLKKFLKQAERKMMQNFKLPCEIIWLKSTLPKMN